MAAITTIFFDLGGVCLSNGWDHEQRQELARQFGFDYEAFDSRHGQVIDALERGQLTLAEYLQWTLFYEPRTFQPADVVHAIEQLSTSFKKSDPAALFAKAQLELQEDPKKALATLEQIDLGKVMAPVADEARSQRAMIHLMLGEVSLARQLADGIDLSRHQDARSRAMMAAVCAEAWARSGNAKKGVETLNLFDPEDATFEQLRPQLYRAQAFAFAQTGDQKGMRRALKKLATQDVRLLGGFMVKRTHPLLQKEAKKLIEQSGLPRRMMIQRG